MDDLLRMDAPVPGRVLARYRRRVIGDLAHARESVGANAPSAAPAPFMVVTPLGLPHTAALAKSLANARVHVRERRALPDWPRVSTPLYVRSCDPARLFRAWVFEALWRKLFLHPRAEVWWLDGAESFRLLSGIKRSLREALAPSRGLRVVTPAQDIHARLHALHVPDEADWARDAAWVDRHVRARVG